MKAKRHVEGSSWASYFVVAQTLSIALLDHGKKCCKKLLQFYAVALVSEILQIDLFELIEIGG